jgi:type IV secretory pathway VirD2 relaxase
MPKKPAPFPKGQKIKAAPPPGAMPKDPMSLTLMVKTRKVYEDSPVKRIKQAGPIKVSGLGAKGSAGKRSRAAAIGRGSVGSHLTPARAQRAVVKISYSAMRGQNKRAAWRAHASYLSRVGAQNEAGKGEGFDAVNNEVDLTDKVTHWADAGDERLFKMIISPERGKDVDLKKVTRAVISEMEKELETKLQWAAIDHYNTDNPHVHVIIRGLDQHGKELVLSPQWIKERPRNIVQDIMTQELGYRTDKDIAEAKEKSVAGLYVTPLDRELRKRMEKSIDGQTVEFTGKPKNEMDHESRIYQIRRLKHLEGYGLAESVGPSTWRIAKDFEKAIKQAQILKDVTKSLNSMKELTTEPNARPMYHGALQPGEFVIGRVIGGALDEHKDRPFFVVEGYDHRHHLIDSSPALEKMRLDGRINNGDLIALRREEKGYSLHRWGIVVGNAVPASATLLGEAWSLDRYKAGMSPPPSQPVGFSKAFHAVAARTIAQVPEKDRTDPKAVHQAFEDQRVRELAGPGKTVMPWRRKTEGTPDLVGRVLWKGRDALLVQGVDGGYYQTKVGEVGKFAPRIGADVWIRANDPKLEVRKFDEAIAKQVVKQGGTYNQTQHLADLQAYDAYLKSNRNGQGLNIPPEKMAEMAEKRMGTWERVGVFPKTSDSVPSILGKLEVGFADANRKAAERLPWGKIDDKHLTDEKYMRRLLVATKGQDMKANLKVARSIVNERERVAQRAEEQARKARQRTLELDKSRGAGR